MRRILILLSVIIALLATGPLGNAVAAANAARDQARLDRTWLAARDATKPKRPPVKPSPTPTPTPTATMPAPSPTPTTATPTAPPPTTPPPTTPPPTTPPPTASPSPSSTFGGHVPAGVVGRVGEQLVLNGKPYRFTGVNAYQLGTDFSMNIGCGNQVKDLDALFRSLRPDSMVRFWAFQNQAFNKNTRQLDFSSLDRVVRAAERNGQRLVFTFGEQAGVCDDGHWKDKAWYQGDFRRVFDDEGRGQVVSYWDWTRLVVQRYKTSPAVGMWELLNEPQVADCPAPHKGRACYGQAYCPPGHAEALRDFFTIAGQEIKRLDPHHLVSSGTNAHGECGVWEQYFEMAGSSPGIDVLSIHDYDPAPLIDLTRNHLYRAQRLNKPVLFGEVGTDASPTGGNCYSLPDRAGAMQRKLDTVLDWRGVAGFLTWEWVEQRESWQQGCSLAVTPADPLMTTLRTVNLRAG